MKQLLAWATASKHSYQRNIFTRTWWNIVIFHTFFVLVMVIIFGVVLYYTKLNIFSTFNQMLSIIISGGTVDAAYIAQTSAELDQANMFVLIGMVIFSTITGVIAAHITLVPTRNEFAQRKKFITAVAHELRTPLAVLRTSNEVALYDVEEHSPAAKVFEENIEETKHIANILNNLIIFSRAGAEESLAFEFADLSLALDAAVKKLEVFAEKRAVQISYTHVPVPKISANATAIEQMFYNLVKNAIVYAKPQGGSVTIETVVTDTALCFSFIDTGIGMSEKNLKHIFEPFFRINPDSSQSASGSGLGLALVFEIMKLHKGAIRVESTEGTGTTFTLQFPLALTRHQETESEFSQDAHVITYTFRK